MESFLRNLKKQVTCSICLDIYKEPKTISCLHTFCCECLSNHARASNRQGKFPCPECRAEIDFPEGNRFDSLPTSFFHNSLLSLLAVRQIGDGSGITCAHCKKRSSDVHYCFDCAKFMCPGCLSAHEVMRASFEGHRVMPVKDFQAEDYEALLKRQPFCSQQYHEREITRFFCIPCQSCVCHICIVTDHRSHKVILLDKAADNEKENIMEDAELAREKEKALKDVIRKFEETISLLKTNFAKAERGVLQTAEQMIAKIKQREREAITSLRKTRDTRLERINKANEKAQSLLKQMYQAVEFAQNLVQRSSSSDIMQNKETLKQRFKELRDIEVPKHQETSFLKFTAASVEGLRLGDITTEGVDASQCTLEGLDQTLQAGVEAELILCPRTPEGEICNKPHLKKQVKVLIEPIKDVTNVNISEKKSGEFKVKFTPKVPGAYSIEVKINGDKLPNSPFTMQVKERELVVVGELDLKLFQGDKLLSPRGIAVNTKGNIALTDNKGHSVYIFDKEGNCLRKIGSRGEDAGQFDHPWGVTYLNDNEVLIADAGNNRIQQLDVQTGTVVKSLGKRGAAKGQLDGPVDVCLDELHHIVVTEYLNRRILVITQEGVIVSVFGDSGPEKLGHPTSCIPYKNTFLVSDAVNGCIKAFYRSGTCLSKFGKQGNQDGQFNGPHGMLVDSSGNLLVCDSDNNRVQQFSLDGRFTGKTLAYLPGPIGIATAPDGRILVTSDKAKKVYILK
ncbi:E3 ubiquitin-protein ligase TRIM45-like [Oculina patagonica]